MKRSIMIALFLALTLVVAPAAVFAEPTEASSSNCTYHWVKRGQTLSGIAVYYGVDMWTLAKQNGIKNPNRIYAGQKLLIRCKPAPKPTPKPPAKPPYYPPPPHPGDSSPPMHCQITPVLGFGRVWH